MGLRVLSNGKVVWEPDPVFVEPAPDPRTPCERCYKPIGAGEHGLGICPYEPRKSTPVRPDTIDFYAENAWPDIRHFTSQKAYEHALDESGLMLKPPKARGAEPVSPDTLRWAAERLAARTSTYPVETRLLEETFTVRAEE